MEPPREDQTSLGVADQPELDVEEGLIQVGDDVFDIFDADGEPDQPSVMPTRSRTSGGMEAWVISAGREISVSTPPRLSASEQSFT